MSGGFRTGGYLKEIPKPHRRRFPGDEPRRVTIRVHSWVGLSPGARHWYVSISEENNPLWNEADQCWQTAWDDDGAKGEIFEQMEFAGKTGRDRALAYMRKVIRERYSDEKLWRVEQEIQELADAPAYHEGD